MDVLISAKRTFSALCEQLFRLAQTPDEAVGPLNVWRTGGQIREGICAIGCKVVANARIDLTRAVGHESVADNGHNDLSGSGRQTVWSITAYRL